MTGALPYRVLRRRLLALSVMAVVLGGCQPGADRSDEPGNLASQLHFVYQRVGGSGFMDQTLAVMNSTDSPLVMDAALQALDDAGEPVPGVTVQSVYGSSDERQVLMPGENIDLLVFKGESASLVRDVRVTPRSTTVVEVASVTHLVDAVPISRSGRELQYPAGVASVELRNPNDVEVSVGLAFIIWNQPARGDSQQALKVLDLSTRIRVPARGEAVVDIPLSDRRLIDRYALSHAASLKAYYTE